MNPIENLWHELKEYVRREVNPTSKAELIAGIKHFGRQSQWRSVRDTVKLCMHAHVTYYTLHCLFIIEVKLLLMLYLVHAFWSFYMHKIVGNLFADVYYDGTITLLSICNVLAMH